MYAAHYRHHNRDVQLRKTNWQRFGANFDFGKQKGPPPPSKVRTYYVYCRQTMVFALSGRRLVSFPIQVFRWRFDDFSFQAHGGLVCPGLCIIQAWANSTHESNIVVLYVFYMNFFYEFFYEHFCMEPTVSCVCPWLFICYKSLFSFIHFFINNLFYQTC